MPQLRFHMPAILASLFLAGCGTLDGPTHSESIEPLPAADDCGAAILGHYLHKLASAETMTSIRSVVAHDRIRAISPGDAVTMDFRADRLNIEIGADGRIQHFRCG